jgi:hypothetical protein
LLGQVIFIDCISVGALISTVLWWCCNRYLREKSSSHAVDEHVEWQYAFDVHCNAFFPLLLILHVLQIFLLTLVNHEWFISALVGDTMWLAAVSWYFYITFLGYSALPFLRRTVLLLYPIVLLVGIYIVALLLQWNISRALFRYYGLQED